MSNDIARELIKVANNLDNMGFIKEANSLDKIARKIVSSQDSYKDRINKYKELITKWHNESDTQKKYQLWDEANNFLTNVEMYTGWDDSTMKAFMKQANNIKKELLSGVSGVNSEKLNDRLYALLLKNNLIDANQNIKEKDLDNFRNIWLQNISPQFDESEKQWLTNKFNLLTIKLKDIIRAKLQEEFKEQVPETKI